MFKWLIGNKLPPKGTRANRDHIVKKRWDLADHMTGPAADVVYGRNDEFILIDCKSCNGTGKNQYGRKCEGSYCISGLAWDHVLDTRPKPSSGNGCCKNGTWEYYKNPIDKNQFASIVTKRRCSVCGKRDDNYG